MKEISALACAPDKPNLGPRMLGRPLHRLDKGMMCHIDQITSSSTPNNDKMQQGTLAGLLTM